MEKNMEASIYYNRVYIGRIMRLYRDTGKMETTILGLCWDYRV